VGVFPVAGEPHLPVVELGVSLARGLQCDMVIGVGGGSVLDVAKAIAGLAPNPGDPLDYMEVVGAGRPLTVPALPVIAVPTTAGTGSEATRNAVIGVPGRGVKVSLRHPSLLPRLALVDSSLTLGLPRDVTAACGLDALSQLLEAYVSRKAQALTDGLCREGLARCAWALPRACEVPDDAGAREAMSTAALMSGMALANAGLGIVHGIAGPLGGAFHAPHGAVCAALLPHACAANIRALREREPGSEAMARYQTIAGILFGQEIAERLCDKLQELVKALGIPGLGAYGVSEDDVVSLAERAGRASSTRGNPIDLTPEEIEAVIRAAL
jgi:alcohol dehydrogenase class IV